MKTQRWLGTSIFFFALTANSLWAQDFRCLRCRMTTPLACAKNKICCLRCRITIHLACAKSKILGMKTQNLPCDTQICAPDSCVCVKSRWCEAVWSNYCDKCYGHGFGSACSSSGVCVPDTIESGEILDPSTEITSIDPLFEPLTDFKPVVPTPDSAIKELMTAAQLALGDPVVNSVNMVLVRRP